LKKLPDITSRSAAIKEREAENLQITISPVIELEHQQNSQESQNFAPSSRDHSNLR
jgi:hypothetical protein